MRKAYVLTIALGLAACGEPLTPAQDAASTVDANRIQVESAAVQLACSRVMPLAAIGSAIPAIGAIAAGVQIGCGTVEGVARLAGTAGSALWLGQQEEMLKAAIGRARLTPVPLLK